ncbi:hypothetical protein [Pseudoduganella buxea]|uniref:Uncharacterized protein n=1 Tax=Pseudoduganella buxea TaxID=1949069 RepID=A0A6I3SX03_9BURK|nr:hypothetical protein [Pseudoduganella buxea]MTV53798.1 hypothetical protein [Pseudoduganella buxea]GGC00823.1 hypothetical protein GCM10011572_23560 [Pseudoduganella buxea]
MQSDNQNRPGQPPIHTQLPDSIPPGDARKIVGEAVPQGADYNSPPPQGAGKSMGSGLDDVGGPGMGQPPGEGGEHAATVRDRDSRADDRHMASMQQGQGGSRQDGGQQNEVQQDGNRGDAGKDRGAQRDTTGSVQGGTDGGNAQRGDAARSEGLLPGQGEDDGRYDVAEEVSMDQQSDRARSVGSMDQAVKGPHGDQLQDAVARTLGKGADKQK